MIVVIIVTMRMQQTRCVLVVIASRADVTLHDSPGT